MPLPRWARGMNEVEWATSRRYVPYTVATFAVSLTLCWGFWFVASALPVKIVLDATGEFTGEDSYSLTMWLPSILASLVTPLHGLLWFLEEAEQVRIDRGKVRILFGRRSWKALRRFVVSRRAEPPDMQVRTRRVAETIMRRR